ncbi:CPTP protein, partial [Geococcyx californianus]|nr:CPTP protein [Geococcyx californianus]
APAAAPRCRRACAAAGRGTADTMAGEPGAFSLREVLTSFQTCVTERREVLLGPYLQGWRGLVRFLQALGTVFSLICKDAVAKVQIMEGYLSGEHGARYESLQLMVQHELAEGLVGFQPRSGRPDSGCRTLLRLHRALRWLELFLEGLRTASHNSRTSAICTESYNASLAAYHPWFVQKVATAAFCTLPSRDTFLESMNAGTAEEAVAMLGEALPCIRNVYSITQELFAQHGMLDLP